MTALLFAWAFTVGAVVVTFALAWLVVVPLHWAVYDGPRWLAWTIGAVALLVLLPAYTLAGAWVTTTWADPLFASLAG